MKSAYEKSANIVFILATTTTWRSWWNWKATSKPISSDKSPHITCEVIHPLYCPHVCFAFLSHSCVSWYRPQLVKQARSWHSGAPRGSQINEGMSDVSDQLKLLALIRIFMCNFFFIFYTYLLTWFFTPNTRLVSKVHTMCECFMTFILWFKLSFDVCGLLYGRHFSFPWKSLVKDPVLVLVAILHYQTTTILVL